MSIVYRQAAVERSVVNLDFFLLLVNDVAGLAGTHVNTWVILILDLLQSSFPHGNVDRIHLALLKDVMSVGPFIIKAGLNLVDSLTDIFDTESHHDQ